jgi:hypothetical protein
LFGGLPFVSTMLETLINGVMDGLSREISMVLFTTFGDTCFEYFDVRIALFLLEKTLHFYGPVLII